VIWNIVWGHEGEKDEPNQYVHATSHVPFIAEITNTKGCLLTKTPLLPQVMKKVKLLTCSTPTKGEFFT
jgi:hypothetical protein